MKLLHNTQAKVILTEAVVLSASETRTRQILMRSISLHRDALQRTDRMWRSIQMVRELQLTSQNTAVVSWSRTSLPRVGAGEDYIYLALNFLFFIVG